MKVDQRFATCKPSMLFEISAEIGLDIWQFAGPGGSVELVERRG
jgi:hypothetical protein